MKRLALLAWLLVAVIVAGCAGDKGGIDRRDYIQRNQAILRRLPSPPGATLVTTMSQPYFDRDVPDASVSGYWTLRILRTPKAFSAAKAVTFYNRRLRPEWRVVNRSVVPSLSLINRSAYLFVQAERGQLLLKVDHGYCHRPRLHCR